MSENKQLQPHQQRVVDELKDLKDKTSKLMLFIKDSEIFKNLIDPEEKKLLIEQSVHMVKYQDILEIRISKF